MKPCLRRLTFILPLALSLAGSALAQTTTFTYQGRLNDGAGPANGLYDLIAVDFSAPTGGSSTAFSLATNVWVTNGLFTARFDLSELAFPGADRWLEIGVRTNGGGEFAFLSPRQQVTSAPYAIRARHFSGVISNAQLSGSYSGPVVFSNGSNLFSGAFSGSGAGLTNLSAWRLGGNAGTVPGTHFLGSTDPQPLELRVNNTPGLRLQPNGGETPSLVGGAGANAIAAGAVGSVIAGGGSSGGFHNTISARYGTIGGGADNHVDGQEGTVAGGNQNFAVGVGAFVGGGRGNWASGTRSAVAGGHSNQAPGAHSLVGGGRSNLANGDFAVVAGGSTNQALNFNATVGGGSRNIARNNYDTVGGGSGNEAAGTASTISGGWYNRAAGYLSTAGGGQFNEATGQSSVIAGGAVNRTADFAAVGGGRNNSASGTNTTVAGGMWNVASGDFSSVGGGTNNLAGSQYAVVGGGQRNSISETFAWNSTIAGGAFNQIGANAVDSTIGGGVENVIEPGAHYSVIAGGASNTNGAGFTRAVISGGQENRVSGPYGTIPGGFHNEAAESALAGGSAAKARHRGSWVWADNAAGFDFSGNYTGSDFASTRTNQFLIRASGGVGINTNNPQATLHVRGNIAADALRAPGAGINTGTFAFTHRVTAGSISGAANHVTQIDNPLCNGDANAILIVTHNWTADNSANKYHPQVVGVYYAGNRWNIFHEDNATAMEVGDAFNVLVIKP